MKILFETAPLLAFFYGYKTGDMITATTYMLFMLIPSTIILYFYEGKVSKVNLVSAALLSITASLTIFTGNTIFIKIKPTILYSLSAIVLFVTNYRFSPAIKYVLGSSIKLKDPKDWYVLNKRFMWFFILMATINEIIWRNCSEDFWVNFKVFGAFPLIILFMSMQVPFLLKRSVFVK